MTKWIYSMRLSKAHAGYAHYEAPQAHRSARLPRRCGDTGGVMWEGHLKLKFIGKWWKISLLCNLAKVLRLETELYSGGTGRGE